MIKPSLNRRRHTSFDSSTVEEEEEGEEGEGVAVRLRSMPLSTDKYEVIRSLLTKKQQSFVNRSLVIECAVFLNK